MARCAVMRESGERISKKMPVNGRGAGTRPAAAPPSSCSSGLRKSLLRGPPIRSGSPPRWFPLSRQSVLATQGRCLRSLAGAWAAQPDRRGPGSPATRLINRRGPDRAGDAHLPYSRSPCFGSSRTRTSYTGASRGEPGFLRGCDREIASCPAGGCGRGVRHLLRQVGHNRLDDALRLALKLCLEICRRRGVARREGRRTVSVCSPRQSPRSVECKSGQGQDIWTYWSRG